jgi:nicotinamide mononucleotide transporter
LENNILELFLAQVRSQTCLDWTITVTALVYIYLAAKENSWCWVWGIISCGLWAYADFFRYNLWVDGILQLFYTGMGFWGLYSWNWRNEFEKPLAISTLPVAGHIKLVVVGLFLTVLMGFLFKKFTPTSYPYFDSLITAFSLLATWLAIRKILENWLYWIVFDALAAYLFWAKGAALVALVMVVYVVISIAGYIEWQRKITKG